MAANPTIDQIYHEERSNVWGAKDEYERKWRTQVLKARGDPRAG
jgi:hypothetical protein